jgi:methionine-rich copper-binding protein CopC
MRSVSYAITLAFAFFGSIAPASAHATLVRSLPAAGSKVSPPPTELRMTFSEMIDFVSARVVGRGGKKVQTGPAKVDDTVLVIPLSGSLAPGVYQVNWEVMSTDTHKARGRFSFEVAR